ncbi:EamA family transporter RarD [Stieleria varia]|uniref:Putative DMT superfamily transporter inner membrane protein n=1 Tax=Stieleria varia TaxID=2528005 RepID=A0A5C6BAV8_9BACT|nr:EamA family transporter RarD [Stieleria varia]TWU08396.1 putative DMT superfamily transporter inner membrane protein [Stieleria varia]
MSANGGILPSFVADNPLSPHRFNRPNRGQLNDPKPSVRVITPRLRNGIIFAVTAHVLWGLFPLFWRQLSQVDSVELVCHRIIWATVILSILVPIQLLRSSQDEFQAYLGKLRRPSTWLLHGVAGMLIFANWMAFIWAVNHGRVLEASLGYYINPLLNVLMGVVFLGERLSRPQWLAITIAAIGVSAMTAAAGKLPWVSLVMATSFASYSLAKKKAQLDSFAGLLIEMSVLIVPAIVYVLIVHSRGEGSMGQISWRIDALLVCGGLATLVPLGFFAAAAQRTPLALIGILQYVGPTLQFLIGAVYLGETMGRGRVLGFSLIWCGSAIFLANAVRAAKKQLRQAKTLPSDSVGLDGVSGVSQHVELVTDDASVDR